MILPLRVFGSESVKRMSSGFAKAPISFATCSRSSAFSWSDAWYWPSSVTNADSA